MKLTNLFPIALVVWMVWMHLRPGAGGCRVHGSDADPLKDGTDDDH